MVMIPLPLTPAQWLPKPATSWFPEKCCALRATWSLGERESRFPSRCFIGALGWCELRRSGGTSLRDGITPEGLAGFVQAERPRYAYYE
jgi:hypothetical protein